MEKVRLFIGNEKGDENFYGEFENAADAIREAKTMYLDENHTFESIGVFAFDVQYSLYLENIITKKHKYIGCVKYI